MLLTSELVELSSKVKTEENVYLYIPYWFKLQKDGCYLPITLENIPGDLKVQLEKYRDNETEDHLIPKIN